MFELVDEIDHVLAHGRPVYAEDKPTVLESGVLRLDLLHHLFAKRTDFGRTRNGHVFRALVSTESGEKKNDGRLVKYCR